MQIKELRAVREMKRTERSSRGITWGFESLKNIVLKMLLCCVVLKQWMWGKIEGEFSPRSMAERSFGKSTEHSVL